MMYIESLTPFDLEQNQKFLLSRYQELEKYVEFFQNIYFCKNDKCLKKSKIFGKNFHLKMLIVKKVFNIM